MRKQFVTVTTRRAALLECPWAVEIVSADGGYWCFESPDDARVWRAQR